MINEFRPMNHLTSLQNFICTIGNLPTSYALSLSYEEQIWWLCNFLEKKVFPAIEENTNITEETQQAFIELQNYVRDYFNNLDVQEEINNKLDEMVEDGTFDNIINQQLFGELNTKVNVLSYKSTKFVENIIEGTPQKVLFTGDSITFGQVPSGTIAVDNPFPSLIQSFIRNWYENNNIIECLNYGVRGAISTNANNNFSTYLAQNPDVIFWGYGTNDVTQLRSNETILADLETFYLNCINNNIELIVIIPAPNFVNLARRQGMKRLHNALINYCKSRGIIFVDMFNYVNNLYNTASTTHDILQPDNTHFNDYTCFRDAIISSLFPITYVQNNNKFNYIEVDSTPNYVKSNIAVVTPSGGINIFSKALRVTSENNNTFKMNILVNKPSILMMNGYSNNTAGKAKFILDGNTFILNEYNSSSSTVDKENMSNFKFPVVLNSGLHEIELNEIIFDSDTINRFYIYGFILEEINTNLVHQGYRQIENEITCWSGNETSLTDEPLNKELSKFNELLILVGYNNNNFQQIRINPVNPVRKFYENNIFKFPVVYNDNIGILTVNIDFTNNQISLSSNINIPIRKIYMYNNSNIMGYIPVDINDYLNI